MIRPEIVAGLDVDGTIERKRPTKLRIELILIANLVLMFAGFLLLATPFYPKPSVWTMLLELAPPWLAVGAVWCFPGRFRLFGGGRFDRRPFLGGVLFFAAFFPLGACCYTKTLHLLRPAELACIPGIVLFVAAMIAEVRADGKPILAVVALPLSILYGYGSVVQLNCLLDHSPVTVYQTVVSHKSNGSRSSQLNLKPWGTNPPARSLDFSYAASVPSQLLDALQVGETVCVIQRQGALGLTWYTVQLCPWNRERVILGSGGSL
ncbi:MAG TPA: hypothetical protein VLY24_18470 [Bryobacteraceae bacterium]|nr:hypothetical protein [Bryobacteraceae bacterium]